MERPLADRTHRSTFACMHRPVRTTFPLPWLRPSLHPLVRSPSTRVHRLHVVHAPLPVTCIPGHRSFSSPPPSQESFFSLECGWGLVFEPGEGRDEGDEGPPPTHRGRDCTHVDHHGTWRKTRGGAWDWRKRCVWYVDRSVGRTDGWMERTNDVACDVVGIETEDGNESDERRED